MSDLSAFIRGLPKAELHMHLEGSIEPDLLLDLARRNGVTVPWRDVASLRAAYDFSDLQSFLDLYYAGCQVLVQERDFYEMTSAYLRRAHADNVVRAEVFLGMQNFTLRGIDAAVVMKGVLRAMEDAARDMGISAGVMVIVQRHRSEADAYALLEQIMPWADRIVAIGLGGAEIGNPPSRFARFFKECRERGFRVVIHAGEEGPADYVREAFEMIGADRIDHGNACLDDPDLVRALVAAGTPLTLCPISNLRLKGVRDLRDHPLKRLKDAGVRVTINSDDPSYFGGYINDNYLAVTAALDLSRDDLVAIAGNSLAASFAPLAEKERYFGLLEDYARTNPGPGAASS